MKILFYLAHPAQFHLFKNTIYKLKKRDHEILIMIRDKDILKSLLRTQDLDFKVLFEKRKSNSIFALTIEIFIREINGIKIAKSFSPDLIIGTPFDVSIIGRLLSIPSVIVNEDDASVIPITSKLSYPFCDYILSPSCCDNGKWEDKSIKYKGYQELAYLHPNNFIPNREKVSKYVKDDEDYYIIRLAKLNAHHDRGKSGINNEVIKNVITNLKNFGGKIFISAERELPEHLEKYRVSFPPEDMHHFLAFADIFIGDSQTMAAEAALLGTPAIRFNDFVGKIGYLDDLEKKYNLTTGISTSEPDRLFFAINQILSKTSMQNQVNKSKMLADKIDFEKYLTWFIEHFPNSAKILEEDPDYQLRFK